MIGQIDIEKSLLNAPNDRSLFVAVASVVNSLIDAVNELQKNVIISKMEKVEIPAGPYAEQRKWIGKLCKFWDNDDTQQLSYGVLTKIDTESGFGVQYCCNDEYDYDDCQPVKPDDDIIYKGGDNE